MERTLAHQLALLVLLGGGAVPAFAQGGGASTTGTIQGRVTDAQGAVLPGVTVIASSPAMIGTQTQATNENGLYRFPAVPPGVFTLTFEFDLSPQEIAARHPERFPTTEDVYRIKERFLRRLRRDPRLRHLAGMEERET